MWNVAVSVDDEVHRIARVAAADTGPWVSAMAREYVNSLARGPLKRSERTLSELIANTLSRGVGLSSAGNLPREKLHDRNALR